MEQNAAALVASRAGLRKGAGMMDTGNTDTHEATGREAVRELFVQRLATSGLQRGKGANGKPMTEAEHEALMQRLVTHLAYLSRPSLVALADEVLRAAGGPKRNVWPSEVLIRQMAAGKEDRPPAIPDIVRSWLASVAGPRAEASGYLVQLYRHLIAHPRPVMPHDLTLCQRQAVEDRSMRDRVQERIALGVASDADRAWLRRLVDDEAAAREIVARGDQARAARAQAASQGDAA
ncbi:hypothetical protein SAMN05421774_11241 [Gemmobacter megaterium]|uniref:Uncharacterized protein n=1 Tax=Gemmobacter megaterium TaxID=1086013 RepID=A0A1N7QIG8_9RHOB|nr:hypothetical protein [Gemmobacter megaterium]GGE26682.1 hypothetical protein GCM10011345_35870 [Gemmobacter megaterium]SIT22680.1 hypothetical protein SAMN05421774_11241 [Gemmobacter megaterium]